MASVPSEGEGRILREQLEVMLFLGEAVAVEDPVTGEVYYTATQKLQDMVDGRCTAEEPEPRRYAHHAKKAPAWHFRSAMLVFATGVVIAATLPAVTSTGNRQTVQRVVGDTDEQHVTSGGRTGPTVARRFPAPAVRAALGDALRRPARVVFRRGNGRHRAVRSHVRSRALWSAVAGHFGARHGCGTEIVGDEGERVRLLAVN